MKVSVSRRQFYSSELNSTTTVYAEPGFGTPKACIIHYCTTNANLNSFDTTTIQQAWGVSYAVGSGATAFTTSMAQVQQDAAATSQGSLRYTNNAGPIFVQGSGSGNSNIWRSTGCAFINGGMTIFWANPTSGGTPPPDQRLDAIFIFFTGSDLQAANFQTSLALNVGIGLTFDVGFQPDVLIGLKNRAVAGSNNSMSYGYATRNKFAGVSNTSVLTQGSAAWHISFAQANMVQRSRHSRYFLEDVSTAGTAIASAQSGIEVDYFTSTGFHIIDRNANHASGTLICGLALKFNNEYYGSSYSTLNTTGIEKFDTRFVPQFILGVGTGTTTQNLVSAPKSPDGDAISVFAATGGSNSHRRYCFGTISVTSGATAVSGTGTSFRAQLSEDHDIYNTSGTLIGVVGAINSNTSLTLKSGATATMTDENFIAMGSSQFSTIQGNEYNNADSFAFTSQSSDIELCSSSGTVPSAYVSSNVVAFNRKPNVRLDFNLADSNPRWGWFLAISDNNRRTTGTE